MTPGSQGLGEDQLIAHPGPAVGEHLVRMDHAGHGEPVFQFRIIDAVAAHEQGPGLMNLIQAAGQNSLEHLLGHGLNGVADNVEGRQGPPAHGVHVA